MKHPDEETTERDIEDYEDIVEGVRRVKEKLAAEYGYDIPRMAEAIRESQAKRGHQVVSFVKKPDAA